MLGACFAYVVYMSGSIYVSMALHFMNNFISVVGMMKPEILEKLLPILAKEELSVVESIIIAVIGIACAAAGFLLMKKRKNK